MKPIVKKLVTLSVASTLTLLLVGTLGLLVTYIYLNPRLPDIDTLKDVKLQVPLRVYARGGELIAEFGEMKRIPLKYEEYPPLLVKAVLAAEDDRFFEHPGVDYQGILRAAYHLVRTGEKGQGGSTITMQVARNFFLSREKTYLRKLNEIFLALKIEDELSKEAILELYLNKIYLGKRAYGFAAAAQVYYGVKPEQLTLAEMAMIAGLPKAPSRYNPVVNPERALIRRNYVLGRMHELEYIDDAAYQSALNEPVHAEVHGLEPDLEAPYVAEMVRNQMVARFGESAYTEGYQVFTTIDARLQKIATQALRDDLLAYDRRHGYRGVEGHIALLSDDNVDDIEAWQAALDAMPTTGNLVPAVVIQLEEQSAWAYTRSGNIVYLPWEQLSWARSHVDDNHLGPELEKASDVLKPGDIIYTAPAQAGCSWLAKKPLVAGALVSLEPHDGALQALVGGFDFYDSKFNRVTQAKRQPGSSFKPFVYTAAIDKGFTAASIINDAPVVFDAPGLEDTWRPENYSGNFYGPTRLRQALIHSRNLVSIRLLRDIGIGYALRYVRRFGFDRASLPRDLSLALGSGVLTPLELATAYAIFANGGYRVEPYVIDYVLDIDGKVVSLTQTTQICVACSDAEADRLQAEAEAGPEKETPTLSAEEQARVEEEAQLHQQEVDMATARLAVLEPTELAETLQGPQPRRVAPRVLSPQVAYLMNTMMRDVIRYGTGRRALVLKRQDLAGKTGTTNDQRDAWFAGFNKDLVTIVWVGFDNPLPLGNRETGAQAALPMWIDFMRAALQGRPEQPLVQPPGIVSVRIDARTGELARAGSPDAVFEYFRADHVPTSTTENLAVPDGVKQVPAGDITEQLF
ncbi:MAG: penicillin-binding protein 1A [Proteobacteria bacterium]|jgi:penicillin-binding protein 1A|nr:penicillin-binding protein 1A [Pseudomonadota bacterium]MCG6935463.1 penicillin-binding protein 1A [Pseudomonadota bacterium]